MRLVHVSIDDADAIAASLTEKRILEGTFNVLPRPGFVDRFQIVPADGHGTYTGMTGVDRKRGRVTLLRNHTDAILLLEATAKPYT